jgi:hypothetical protein
VVCDADVERIVDRRCKAHVFFPELRPGLRFSLSYLP